MDIQLNKTYSASISYEVKKETNLPADVVGVVSGYAATYDKDKMGDEILPGAFSQTLKKYKEENKRIKVYVNHKEQGVGYIEPNDIYEDEKGLYVKKMNLLKVPEGEAAYILAKNGVLTDMSIKLGMRHGDYENLSSGGRKIKNIELGEVSLVYNPANSKSVVTDVKSATEYHNFPMASLDHEWDSEKAIERIRKWSDSESEPSEKYKQAFMYFDKESDDNFGSYKLPYADVIGGELKVVPKAIYAIEGALNGARGGLKIADEDKEKIKGHVEKYLSKIEKEKEDDSKSDEEKPEDKSKEESEEDVKSKKFNSSDAVEAADEKEKKDCDCGMKKDVVGFSQVKSMSRKEFEKSLRTKGFSRKSAMYITSKVLSQSESDEKTAIKSLPSDSAEAVSNELKVDEIINLLKKIK